MNVLSFAQTLPALFVHRFTVAAYGDLVRIRFEDVVVDGAAPNYVGAVMVRTADALELANLLKRLIESPQVKN